MAASLWLRVAEVLPAFILETVKELKDEIRADHLYVDSFSFDIETLAEILHKQFHAVAVARDCIRRESPLGREVRVEESGDEVAECNVHFEFSRVFLTCASNLMAASLRDAALIWI